MEPNQLSLGLASSKPRAKGRFPTLRSEPVVSAKTRPDAKVWEAALALAATFITAPAPLGAHLLISCSKQKRPFASPAADLYCSPLFRQSLRLARRTKSPFSILSGQHGLIDGNAFLEPYDFSLKSATPAEQIRWADNVASEVGSRIPTAQTLLILAGNTYTRELASRLDALDRSFERPLSGLSMGQRLSCLKHVHRILDRREHIEELYRHFSTLDQRVGLAPLKELLKRSLPQKGVYFFFDPTEETSLSRNVPRLVRIGTHGISEGSKASLRQRLRAHYGTASQTGNHRSSVFRLHVGAALLEQYGATSEYPTWGKGQNADTSTIVAERAIEREVSEYIGKLLVTYVPLEDKPGKHSFRAVLERETIALLSESNVPVDHASKKWLGLRSVQKPIRASGLWNIRSVGGQADLRIVKLIERHVSNL